MAIEIRVITPVTTSWFRKPEHLEYLQRGDVRISHSILRRGPPSIESELDEALAVPDLVERVIEAESSGVDAVVIDCMGDPGLRAAREAVRIPVIGPSEASMHLASMMGYRFSVVTVLDSVRALFENAAVLCGLASRLASVRVVDIPVLELDKDLARLHGSLSAQAQLAIEQDRADVIIFGCTGMLGCTDAVTAHLEARGFQVPVIDPVPVAVRLAESFVRSGLRHSKRRYPTPPAREYVGYESLTAARKPHPRG